MVIIPKEKPVISNLNTYYLDITKLIEHYQGEIGSGGLFFGSASAKGVIFFDQDEILNGYFRDQDSELSGDDAINRLMETDFEHNYTVEIYNISLEEVYFWSSLPSAERIYKDLSTEFTDLEGLIKKMSAEKLTGFIEVTIEDEKEEGLIFISNGEIVGGSFSWVQNDPSLTKANINQLVEKTKKSGGLFQVSRIPVSDGREEEPTGPKGTEDSSHTLKMLEEFLGIFETFYATLKTKDSDFNSVVRKKFVESAEKFDFLDPFAAEFEYTDRRIIFTGDADDEELMTGVLTSVTELAQELGVLSEFKRYLAPWLNKYEGKLTPLNINF